MTKLSISRTGAGRIAAAAIAAITLTAGSCQADELGPSCKQFLQLKMQCLGAKANTIESNGNTQMAREVRRSIPFEMHQAIYYLAKNKEFTDSYRMELRCSEDAWYIKNADSPKNYRPQKSVQLCSVTTSWPENYKITPDSDSKVEARIRQMEAEIGIQNNRPTHLVGVVMNKAGMAFYKLGLGILVMTSACVSSAKTPIDQTLDFLVGPNMGGSRSFKCREAINEKVTDEHAYYKFNDDGSYSRLSSHPDPRTKFLQPLNVKGIFRVKIANGLLIVSFTDEFVGEVYLNDHKPYDAVLIGTDNNDTMAMMMDRPVPERPDIRERLRLVCIGDKPSGNGPQRSY